MSPVHPSLLLSCSPHGPYFTNEALRLRLSSLLEAICYSKPDLHASSPEPILLLALPVFTYSPKLSEKRQQPRISIETSRILVEPQNKSFIFAKNKAETSLSSISNSRPSREGGQGRNRISEKTHTQSPILPLTKYVASGSPCRGPY